MQELMFGEKTYEEIVEQMTGDRLGPLELGQIAEIRHQTSLGKVPQVIELIEQSLEAGNKILLFAHHRDVLDAYCAAFPTIFVRLDGQMSLKDRQESVDCFQKDESIRIFIGGIQAAGVGLTLTKANMVVFAEFSWVPGEMEQAISRADRIGQANKLLIWYLAVNGTIDARILDRIVSKQKIIDRAVS
jgi:SWI/SNF-related matrix-associated actin-dependent regulator 1 of chromatin subfamily A